MDETKQAAPVGKRDPRRVAKICEFMTYSAKEAFKRLRTNVLLAFPEEEKKCRVIGITSAQISEGKSTVSINLAYSLAELGKRVLLIDGDLRRPTVHEKMGMRIAPGLSEIVSGTVSLNDALGKYNSSADGTHLEVLTSGELPGNPSELLNSGRFESFIDAVASVYDYVILDLPPVNAVIDAVSVSRCTDGMIVVVRENHCPKYILNDCMDQLRYARANVLGFVMNGCVEGAGKRYQYNQKYYYRYEK